MQRSLPNYLNRAPLWIRLVVGRLAPPACAMLMVFSACTGRIGDDPAGRDRIASPGVPGSSAPLVPSAGPVAGTPAGPAQPGGVTSVGPAATVGPAAAFPVVRETLRLLPFDVRLNRLAQVLGLPPTDKLFAPISAGRLELGDQDYGKGVTPDPSWSPNRMVLWIKLLRPICQSPAFTVKYPTIKTDAAPLIAAAYGRAADPADLEALRTGLVGIPEDRRSELSCLSVLSATEFVAR